ncbi:peptidoglycan editing factor PgeF [Alteromonas gilva]|uniref:Purine nucleoside phosphorylase n=1 Tax=Alteromonas gilva TaxID=2987522 RepID=A0ABT5L9J8_9ALTE|nr:peptidoglycan editing factor PgeF [Alteromonas gilva]MDC8832792.1 peptidoglycan editing factor PgeF [Alteromonas gilva]
MNFELPTVVPQWPAPPNVVAYCTTRDGGVSQGPYQSLNLGFHVHDDPAAVTQNRKRLPHADKLRWLEQIHGHDVIVLPSTQHTADAAISRTPEHYCAVMTADCIPLLLCNKQGTEVAAVHAGWQGLKVKIIEHTLARLSADAQDVYAWIGPAICQQCYEVSHQVAQYFSQYPGVLTRSASADKYLLNLPLVAEYQLLAAGVKNIVQSGLCTYQDARFFSHRQASHHHCQQTGRQVSVIGLLG